MPVTLNSTGITFSDATSQSTAAVAGQRLSAWGGGSGTFTVPSGVYYLDLLIVGAGGGGGGGSYSGKYAQAGAGGGGGGFMNVQVSTTPGSTFSWAVGAGGSAGAYSGNTYPGGSGGAGGTTSFGPYSCTGGGGGQGAVSGISVGGAGGGVSTAVAFYSGGSAGSNSSSINGGAGGANGPVTALAYHFMYGAWGYAGKGGYPNGGAGTNGLIVVKY